MIPKMNFRMSEFSFAFLTAFPFDLLFLFVSETAQLAFVVAPVVADLDEELQEDLLAEELFHILAGRLSHSLEFLALVADQDAFLRVAGHVDRRRDAVDGRLLLVALDLDFAAVGDLLVVEFENLLADDLRGEEGFCP